MTGPSTLLPNGEQQFVDANGVPFANGLVHFYIPNTTTPKNTWLDQGLTTLNTNPVVLDGAGRAVIWGAGVYRQVLVDQFGSQIWDKETSGPDGTFPGNLEITGNLVVDGTLTLGTRPAQFDNSTLVPDTAWVNRVGLQASQVTVLTGAVILTATQLGRSFLLNSASPFAVTLPALAATPAALGTRLEFFNENVGTVTVTCAGSDKIQLNNTAPVGTLALGPGDTLTLESNGTQWLAVGGSVQLPFSSAVGTGGAVGGNRSGLKITNGGAPNTQVAVTANEVALENTTGGYFTARAVSLAVSTGSVGANGLDTGVVANSTWYSVWVIYNGTLVSGLLSTSTTAPTLPAGYTYKARVGWVKTDGSANLLRTLQFGNRAAYQVTAATNTTQLPIIISGVQGSIAAPTVAASVSGAVPPTASVVDLVLWGIFLEPNGVAFAAPNANYVGIAGYAGSNLSPMGIVNGNNAGDVDISLKTGLVLESSNVYFCSNASSSGLSVYGWEDNL